MKYTHRSLSSSHCGLPAFFRHTLSVLGVLLMLLLLAPSNAQAQDPGEKGYWKHHFVSQVNTLVRSTNPALRERGMELIIEVQSREDATAFDFSDARSQLYSIFFDRRNTDQQRILALSALFATDSTKTSETLATWVDEESSDRVRRHVQLAVSQTGRG
jgi:hypothetical protein